jgi:hypothetical protein
LLQNIGRLLQRQHIEQQEQRQQQQQQQYVVLYTASFACAVVARHPNS